MVLLEVLRYCIKDGISRLASNVSTAIILLLVIAISSSYSTAWPSYLEQKLRDTQTISWDVEYFFDGSDSKDNFERLKACLSQEYPESKQAVSLWTKCVVSIEKKPGESDIFEPFEIHLLSKDDEGLYPADVYTTKASALKGDPYSGTGLIIDALTAKKLHVGVGDTLYLGLQVLESDGDGMAVKVSEMDQADMQTWEDVGFFEERVAAVVKPDDNFMGIAAFRPKKNEEAMAKESETFATQLYLFNGQEAANDAALSNLEKKTGINGIFANFASDEIAAANDSYALDVSAGNYSLVSDIALLVVFLACALFDMARKNKRRFKAFAVMQSFGVRSRSIASACLIESLATYGLIGCIGLALGYWIASTFFGLWISPKSVMSVSLVAFLGIIVSAAVQAGFVVRRLNADNILSALTREEE